eukprot:m.251458 g.251458  ORF g.251458 m.251458 type:complete len:354 (-) comp15452_c1_seq1:1197-2258(-)
MGFLPSIGLSQVSFGEMGRDVSLVLTGAVVGGLVTYYAVQRPLAQDTRNSLTEIKSLLETVKSTVDAHHDRLYTFIDDQDAVFFDSEGYIDDADQSVAEQAGGAVKTQQSAPAIVATTSAGAAGDEEQTLYQDLDDLYSLDKRAEAAELALANEHLLQKTPEGLWRLCRSLYDKAASAGTEQGRSFLERGIEYGSKALEIDNANAAVHRWYAVCRGAMAEHSPIKEKLLCGEDFKKHVLISIDLDPSSAVSYHLLGRWSFEVAKLTWFEKAACKSFIGNPPEATYDDCLRYFTKAGELYPDWKVNELFIGKTYDKLGNYQDAQRWYRKCAKSNGQEQAAEDREAVSEARTLVK